MTPCQRVTFSCSIAVSAAPASKRGSLDEGAAGQNRGHDLVALTADVVDRHERQDSWRLDGGVAQERGEGEDAAMGHDSALRVPRRPGRVDDRQRGVGIDGPHDGSCGSHLEGQGPARLVTEMDDGTNVVAFRGPIDEGTELRAFESVHGDEDGGCGVREDVVQFLVVHPRPDPEEDRAQPGAREIDGDDFGARVREHADPVAGAHPQRLETGGGAFGLLAQFAVGAAERTVHDGLAIGVGGGATGEHVPEAGARCAGVGVRLIDHDGPRRAVVVRSGWTVRSVRRNRMSPGCPATFPAGSTSARRTPRPIARPGRARCSPPSGRARHRPRRR